MSTDIRLERRMGQWAASWHDGTAFYDPDPDRAVAMAEADRQARRGTPPSPADHARALELTPSAAPRTPSRGRATA